MLKLFQAVNLVIDSSAYNVRGSTDLRIHLTVLQIPSVSFVHISQTVAKAHTLLDLIFPRASFFLILWPG